MFLSSCIHFAFYFIVAKLLQARTEDCAVTHDSSAASNSSQEPVLFLLCVADEKELVLAIELRVPDMTGCPEVSLGEMGLAPGGRDPPGCMEDERFFRVCTQHLFAPYEG